MHAYMTLLTFLLLLLLFCFLFLFFFVFLYQADLSTSTDPDALPQKYYTVMVEKIPGHLRSAEKLYEYFEELFPGKTTATELNF
jgi:hypothetical protein